MNTKVMIAIIVVIFAADIGWQLYQNWKRDELLKRLDAYLGNKDYAAFDELIDSKEVRRYFPAFNTAFMKLNEAMYKEDMKQIEKAFDSFDMPMNKAQKEALYKKGFYYYLSIEDKDRTRDYYEHLKELKVSDQQSLDMMYDTYILKGYRYLDQIIDHIKDLSEEKQMPFFALLSDMYRNKGENEKADEYEKKVMEYTERLKK